VSVIAFLAYGEPALGRFAGGRFDFTPLIVAAGALLLLRIVFRVRMRWQLVLASILAAPLLVVISHEISYPMTAARVVSGGAAVAAGARRHPKHRAP
jgi:hypothetical protein